jgi:hypothetical protein
MRCYRLKNNKTKQIIYDIRLSAVQVTLPVYMCGLPGGGSKRAIASWALDSVVSITRIQNVILNYNGKTPIIYY